MLFLKVLTPGMLTTVQDCGRHNYQKWGIPVAGAMDEYALRVANILVGNPEKEACLEITLLGPTLEFLADSLVALTGADLGARIEKRECPLWESFWVKKGEKLEFTGVKSGCRSYLAVAGGIDVPVVMGSKSTYLRGSFGGYKGRPLRTGDELERGTAPAPAAVRIPPEYINRPQSPWEVRVVLGPQAESFTEEGLREFLSGEYTVTSEADRMGYRLQGPTIAHKSGADIVSDGIALGSVQVPGQGQPIVMMADRQTVGGYPKIATVITPDLWKLAQAKPGDTIRFKQVELREAHLLYREYEDKIRMIARNLLSDENSGRVEKTRLFRVVIDGMAYTVKAEERRG